MVWYHDGFNLAALALGAAGCIAFLIVLMLWRRDQKEQDEELLHYLSERTGGGSVETPRVMPRHSYGRMLVGVVLAAAFCVSGTLFLGTRVRAAQTQAKLDELAQIVQNNRQPEEIPETLAPTAAATDPAPVETEPEVTEPEPPQILPEYQELYDRNNDLIGWLTIPGTQVDFPVVQSEEPNYYLYRDFDGNDSEYGTVYARESCDVFAPDDNITIYGHRKDDGAIFGFFGDFEDMDYWKDHRYVCFDTLYEHRYYEIFAVFRTTVNTKDSFYYYQYENFQSKADFNQFMSQVRELSAFSSGIPVEYGDKLLCLSTCATAVYNGRLCVICRQIPEIPAN